MSAYLSLALAVALALAPACASDGDQAGPTATTGGATTTAPLGTTTTGPGSTTSEPRSCSAAQLSPTPEPQPDLPAPVRETRDAIVAAAVDCDYEELERLAQRGEASFTYSFGGGDDPAGFWRDLEEDPERVGPPPLEYLVELLDRPHARLEAHEQTPERYAWPSAFGYEDWRSVPDDAREALRPLYDDEDFEQFATFGGYTGYRVGITADGDWLFFVAGD